MNSSSQDPLTRTCRYYDEHAEEYVRSTMDVDLGELYRPFLSLLPRGGSVLDAGCGSGRDSLYFKRAGYAVHALDASPGMVRLSSERLGQEVELATFQTLDYEEAFDGIWACASLVHVPRAEMGEVLVRLARALRPGGVLYASLKAGTGERFEGERFFSRFDEEELLRVVLEVDRLVPEQVWRTRDVRPAPPAEHWINLLALRV